MNNNFDLSSPAIQTFYQSLVNICNDNSPFFYIDEEVLVKDQIHKVRIFSYRLASWEDFNKYKPHSYWCRGTTFDITEEKVRLISLPFRKFFNLNECPDTMYDAIKDKKIAWIAEKLDGSLISSANFEEYCTVKTKQTFKSPQAQKAKLLFDNNPDMFIDYEYTSPDNRIVVPYTEDKLNCLESRFLDNVNLKNIDKDDLVEWLPELKAYLYTHNCCGIKYPLKMDMDWRYYNKTLEEIDIYSRYITNNTLSEGIVVTFQDGQKVKVKTEWYCSLHRVKDSISNAKYVLEVILNDGVDDLLSQDFITPEIKEDILNQLHKVREYVEMKEDKIMKFFHENSQLSRKDYAIKAKSELQGLCEFQTAMSLYGETKYIEDVDFQYIMKKNIDKFVHNNSFNLV